MKWVSMLGIRWGLPHHILGGTLAFPIFYPWTHSASRMSHSAWGPLAHQILEGEGYGGNHLLGIILVECERAGLNARPMATLVREQAWMLAPQTHSGLLV